MSEPESLVIDPKKAQLIALGIHDYDGLVLLAEDQPPYLIEGLLPVQGIGILVGGPGIGKTPLVVSIGISVASGLEAFGHKVEQGPVLYCMGEGELRQTTELIARLSGHLGLPSPPSDFRTYSPYWGEQGPASGGIQAILERARVVRPKLVIIDTLRAFDANAEQRSDFGAELCRNIRALNAAVGCATLLVHHRRKPSLDHQVSLEEDPHVWFNEIVGTNALITQVDSRLGVDAAVRGPAELILGGFVRGHGPIPVHHFVRRFGADGLPVGYELVSGLDRLSPKQRKVFDDLECDFTFTEVKKALGGASDSSPANLIALLRSAGLVEQVRPSGTYRKKT